MKKYAMFMPLSGLPSRHGIGDFGDTAIEFLKWIHEKGFKAWQMLPLNPIGPGASPYMSICSDAFEYRLISLDGLTHDGLLPPIKDYRKNNNRVDYYRVGMFKEKYLRQAYKNFLKKGSLFLLKDFINDHEWVKQYASFYLLLKKNDYKLWYLWNKSDRDFPYFEYFDITSLKDYYYVVFIQYIAFNQWLLMKNKAKELDIELIGDMPFYVDYNSVECFYNRQFFDLKKNYEPRHVGGFPSCFGDNGQYWGMPCYNFNKLKADNYDLLVNRLGKLCQTYDIVRLDHFLGYNSYYTIEFGRENGLIGKWKYGPRESFFKSFYDKYPTAKLIAEDLGWVRKRALKIRDSFSLPGMNVFQFSVFDPNFHYSNSLNVYTSTHDGETLYGWFKRLNANEKKILKKAINYKKGSFYLSLLEYVLNIPSNMTFISMNDYLFQNNHFRINFPSTFGSPNWEYRIKKLFIESSKVSLAIDQIISKRN